MRTYLSLLDSGQQAKNPMRFYTRPQWSLKRSRTTIASTSLLLFFLVTLVYLSPWSSSRYNRVTTNAEVLEKVAKGIDWSRFAYVQYVTDVQYLCNSLMLFEILDRLGCRADRLMLYPDVWTNATGVDPGVGDEVRLVQLARERYRVHLQPIKVQYSLAADCRLPVPVQDHADSNSNLGRKLHQAPRYEPNSI